MRRTAAAINKMASTSLLPPLLLLLLLILAASARATEPEDQRGWLIRALESFSGAVRAEPIVAAHDHFARLAGEPAMEQLVMTRRASGWRQMARSDAADESVARARRADTAATFAFTVSGSVIEAPLAPSAPVLVPSSPICNYAGDLSLLHFQCADSAAPLSPSAYAVRPDATMCANCSAAADPPACESTCCFPAFECRCHAGFSGTLCETARSFRCDLQLLDPAWLPCAKAYRGGDRDPNCPLARVNDPLNATFRLACTANDAADGDGASLAAQFAESPLAYNATRLQLHVINFKRLSDQRFLWTHEMPPAVWTGEANVTFAVSVADAVAAGALAGGRMYFETGLAYGAPPPPGLSNRFVDRQFVDFADLAVTPPSKPSNTLGVILGVVIPVGAILIGAVGTVIVRRRRQQRKAKPE